MKTISTVMIAAFTVATSALAQNLPRPSPKATVSQTVGLTDVTITYSRPSVKGRKIWGDLVPFDKVWRTGANEATSFKITDEVTIDGKKLAAGTYSIHTIPGKDSWTVIFNSVADQWGSYSYDAAKDVLRIQVKPRTIGHHELLTVVFPRVSQDSAEVAIEWEKIAVPFTIKVDTNTRTLAGIRASIAEAKADDWRVYMRSADFANQNGLVRDEARQWLDKSIAIQANYQNLTLKAKILAANGDRAGAIATAEKAIAAGKASEAKVDTSATEKLLAEWRSKK